MASYTTKRFSALFFILVLTGILIFCSTNKGGIGDQMITLELASIFQKTSTSNQEVNFNNKTPITFNRDYPTFLTLTQKNQLLLKKSQKILARIKDNCRKLNISTEWDYEDNFSKPRLLLVKPEHHIMYGSNPKTGSTSFKKFLFILDGDNQSANPHLPHGHYKIVRGTNFFRNKKYFDRYVKILSIRNPITRLLSAFRNKQLRKFWYIKEKVASKMTESEQFARVVRKRLTRSHIADVHLMPQWEQMDICRFPYDVVMQFEEASQYISLVQHLTNTSHVEFPGSRVEKGKDTHDTLYYANQYFGALTPEETEIVYKQYGMDFKVLGYTRYGEDNFPYLSFQDSV